MKPFPSACDLANFVPIRHGTWLTEPFILWISTPKRSLETGVRTEFETIVDVMALFVAVSQRLADYPSTASSVTHQSGHSRWRGKNRTDSRSNSWWEDRVLGHLKLASGSFSRSTDDLVSYLTPQSPYKRSSISRDLPWRRKAYDRTLSCPDLARAINDFLSSDIEFVSNDDRAVQLCA